MFRTVWASILLLFRCFGGVSPSHSFHWFSIGFSLVFRMVWASILLAFLCVPYRSRSAVFWRVSYGLGMNPAAVPLFRRRFSKSFLPLLFYRLFARVSHGLGLNPSSFFMRPLGHVRQFSGSCFVRFGHESCCCSAVSDAFLQVIPSIGFPSAFRSCFAWFGPQSV